MNNDDLWESKGIELVIACQEGRLDDVKRLVEERVPLNEEYVNGWGRRRSPLYSACENDQMEVVRFLLDSGADPNYGRDLPLCKVCLYCKPNCVAITQLLLKHGADVNGKDYGDWTPLICSCFRKEPPIALLELLIGNGANINAVNELGNHALYYAVYNCYVEAWTLLLKNVRNVMGNEQKLMWLIVEKNQSDAPRMITLLRMNWERGLRSIEYADVRDKIVLPPWSPTTHWIYHPSFKHSVKTFLLVWNRMRMKYSTLARELAFPIIKYMSIHETKTVYHGCT